MKKDYEWDEFTEYMRSLIYYLGTGVNEFVENNDTVMTILDSMDQLEVDVPSDQCYNSVEELLQSLKEIK